MIILLTYMYVCITTTFSHSNIKNLKMLSLQIWYVLTSIISAILRNVVVFFGQVRRESLFAQGGIEWLLSICWRSHAGCWVDFKRKSTLSDHPSKNISCFNYATNIHALKHEKNRLHFAADNFTSIIRWKIAVFIANFQPFALTFPNKNWLITKWLAAYGQ